MPKIAVHNGEHTQVTGSIEEVIETMTKQLEDFKKSSPYPDNKEITVYYLPVIVISS